MASARGHAGVAKAPAARPPRGLRHRRASPEEEGPGRSRRPGGEERASAVSGSVRPTFARGLTGLYTWGFRAVRRRIVGEDEDGAHGPLCSDTECRAAAREIEGAGMNPLAPERLWHLSHVLYKRSRRLGLIVKKLNTMIYHNSLPPTAYGAGVWFGHHGFGTVIHTNVRLGRNVRIWHNVTISVHATSVSRHQIVIEDGVRIGANSVIIAPRGRSIRIGRDARIGAGALVVADVPEGATVVGVPSQWRMSTRRRRDVESPEGNGLAPAGDPLEDAQDEAEAGEGLGAVAEFIPPNGSAEQPHPEIGA